MIAGVRWIFLGCRIVTMTTTFSTTFKSSRDQSAECVIFRGFLPTSHINFFFLFFCVFTVACIKVTGYCTVLYAAVCDNCVVCCGTVYSTRAPVYSTGYRSTGYRSTGYRSTGYISNRITRWSSGLPAPSLDFSHSFSFSSSSAWSDPVQLGPTAAESSSLRQQTGWHGW